MAIWCDIQYVLVRERCPAVNDRRIPVSALKQRKMQEIYWIEIMRCVTSLRGFPISVLAGESSQWDHPKTSPISKHSEWKFRKSGEFLQPSSDVLRLVVISMHVTFAIPVDLTGKSDTFPVSLPCSHFQHGGRRYESKTFWRISSWEKYPNVLAR